MPPKKNEDDLQTLPPFKAITILPVLALPVKRAEELTNWLVNKKLSIQKNLSVQRAVEILKEKGLYTEAKKDPKDGKSVYNAVKAAESVPAADRSVQVERLIKEVGVEIIAKNYATIHAELVVQARRQKKDKLEGSEEYKKIQLEQGKKDGKKESKVEEPPPEEPKVVEKSYKMDGDGFVMLLDVPRTVEDIDKIIETNDGLPADIVLLIEQKTMWDWKQPDLNLLSQQPKDVEQLKRLMESPTRTVSSEAARNKPPSVEDAAAVKRGKDLFNQILQKRNISVVGSSLRKICTKQVRFEYNPYKPEESTPIFVDKMFSLAAEFSFDRTGYEEWIKATSVAPMIKPIQIVEKVAVEEKPEDPKAKKDGKKEGKKQQKQPEFVEKIRQLRYEDQPENIKSDLKQLKTVNHIRSPHSVGELLENVLEALERDTKGKSEHSTISHIEEPDIEEIFRQQKELLKQPKQLSSSSSKELFECKLSQSWDQSLQYRSFELSNGVPYDQKVDGPKISSLECMRKLPSNRLLRYYVLTKFESLLRQKKPYRDWNFLNRCYLEQYDQQSLVRTINKELESDPQIISCDLSQDGLKLVVLLQQNPPGRILYHNEMQQWRALPSLDSWIRYFKGNQSNMECKKFFDYSEDTVGNVGTQQKIMMPSDNAPIKEIVQNVGSKKIRRHQILKETCRFGIRKSANEAEFWVLVNDLLNISVMKETVLEVESQIEKEVEKENDVPAAEGEEAKEPAVLKSHTEQTLWLRSKQIILKFWPYATFFSTDHESSQVKRTIGSKGEVIRYFRDKSVWIGYSNGNTAWYRGGNWIRTINNRKLRKGFSPEQLKIQSIQQGEKRIFIRSDQTVTIVDGSITYVTFKDGTTIATDSKRHTTTTTKSGYPTVRVRLEPHKFIDENVIGYGSAYALLGHDNLFERSCDGYIYEVFCQELNYYLYHEKVERDGVYTTSPVRLVCLQEGSILKICPQELIYIANEDRQRLDKLDSVESWLQLFTTRQNWKEGVYHIDLQEGSMQTQDSQGNHFKLYLDRPSETKIAVSLNINDSAGKEEPSFGNGYHVISENFFLPTPKNFVEPRLFVLKRDGSGVQLLSQEQVSNFLERAKKDCYQLLQEPVDAQSTYLQYSRKTTAKPHLHTEKFTKPLDPLPEAPRCLETNPSTYLRRPQVAPEGVLLRRLIRYQPLASYQEFSDLVREYTDGQQQLRHRLKTDYNILTKDQLLS